MSRCWAELLAAPKIDVLFDRKTRFFLCHSLKMWPLWKHKLSKIKTTPFFVNIQIANEANHIQFETFLCNYYESMNILPIKQTYREIEKKTTKHIKIFQIFDSNNGYWTHQNVVLMKKNYSKITKKCWSESTETKRKELD